MPDGVRLMDGRIPVVFYANHAYWWDGFWSQLCTEEFFHQRLHIIIEYQQLHKHRFFTRLGAFSLDRSRPKSVVTTLQYAADLLADRPDSLQNALWIFPQGQIEYVDKRPLRFFRGTGSIVQRLFEQVPQLYLVSVVSRIEYLEEQQPELFLSFREPLLLSKGEPLGESHRLTAYMQEMTEHHLDTLREQIEKRNLSDAVTLLEGRLSINKRVEKLGRLFRRHA